MLEFYSFQGHVFAAVENLIIHHGLFTGKNDKRFHLESSLILFILITYIFSKTVPSALLMSLEWEL